MKLENLDEAVTLKNALASYIDGLNEVRQFVDDISKGECVKIGVTSTGDQILISDKDMALNILSVIKDKFLAKIEEIKKQIEKL